MDSVEEILEKLKFIKKMLPTLEGVVQNEITIVDNYILVCQEIIDTNTTPAEEFIFGMKKIIAIYGDLL